MVEPAVARSTFNRIHHAIEQGLIRSCHDLSEGGLAVAATEMAMAGQLGMEIDISSVMDGRLSATEALFSESNTRFLVEAPAGRADEFGDSMQSAGVSVTRLGTIEESNQLVVTNHGQPVLDLDLAEAKQAWLRPLDW